MSRVFFLILSFFLLLCKNIDGQCNFDIGIYDLWANGQRINSNSTVGEFAYDFEYDPEFNDYMAFIQVGAGWALYADEGANVLTSGCTFPFQSSYIAIPHQSVFPLSSAAWLNLGAEGCSAAFPYPGCIQLFCLQTNTQVVCTKTTLASEKTPRHRFSKK